MAGHHDGFGGQGEQAIVQRLDDGVEVALGGLGVAGTAGEQRVAGEEQRCAFHTETHRAWGVAGVVDGVQAQPTDLDDITVVDEHVVPDVLQHLRVLAHHGDLVPGLANGGNGLNVVPVTVGFQHAPHSESLAHLQQLLVFVGRVDEDCVAGLAAAQHEHIVGVWPDDNSVNLQAAISPMQGGHLATLLPPHRVMS